MVLGLAEPARPLLDRFAGAVVGLRFRVEVGQVVGDVDLPVGGGGVSFYRLILFPSRARHAVVGVVPGLLDVFVRYVSHDIGERIPCRGA